MSDQGIVVLGIPIPSSSPLFLSILAVHVAAGLVCVIAGAVAMLSAKRAGRHPRAGSVYFWSLVVVFVSMTALSILRWPHNVHLLVLGSLSFAAGVVDGWPQPLGLLPGVASCAAPPSMSSTRLSSLVGLTPAGT